jgi:hypothetical protein
MRVLRQLSCTNGLDCPKVYPPRDDGRLPVRGDKPDAKFLDEIGPLPDHEAVVLVPAAVLSDVREVLTLEQLGQFVVHHHHHDLFRLESLPHYTSASDEDDYNRFVRGEPKPIAQTKQAWLDRVHTDVLAGRMWHRVRAISDPPTTYIAYQAQWGYPDLLRAGELIRTVNLTRALAAVGDFFVLDWAHVVRSIYDSDGRFMRAEVMHPDSAAPYIALADLLWNHSEPFSGDQTALAS